MVTIRTEIDEDIRSIHSVVLAAFQSPLEPMLVDKLRNADAAALSLVAVEDEKIVGHILFSPITVENNLFSKRFLGLAPLAVKPEYQRQGIGSKLVRKGLEMCLSCGWNGVFVLGSPTYYSRFGFEETLKHNLFSEYEVSPEDFMVLALRPGGLDGCAGLVSYNPLFKEIAP